MMKPWIVRLNCFATVKNKILNGEIMRKRIIKVTATYDLDDPELEGIQITSREHFEEKVLNKMIDVFSWSEGYIGVEVEVIDE